MKTQKPLTQSTVTIPGDKWLAIVNSNINLLLAAKQAYIAIEREIHPEGFMPSYNDALPPALEALWRVIEEAGRTL